jgi:hypothetical protein
VADGIVNGEAVGDVAAGAVEEEGNRLAVLAGELSQTLDADAGVVFFDVANQVDVAQPLACFFADLGAYGVQQLRDQPIAQLSH